MRLLIVSDLHANLAALERVADTADAIVFLGDAVDYGPDPAAAVEWSRGHASYGLRGNHDEAVGNDGPTGAARAWADLAEASAAWTRKALSADDRAFLGSLPLRAEFTFGGARFLALHAAPLDPLYTYLPPETPQEEWERQLNGVDADWLLYGHTHRPLLARFGRTTVLNPGSVGQPRTGAPLASYAVWDDGEVLIAARSYDGRPDGPARGRPAARSLWDGGARADPSDRGDTGTATRAGGGGPGRQGSRMTGGGFEVEHKWLLREPPPAADLASLGANPIRIEQV